jgi:hydroxyacyl-ACP dehydratase HTD2-like protein with hotdog domain
MSRDALAHLAELERQFDGPIPETLRQAAELGSAATVERLFAAGEVAFYHSLVVKQIALVRLRRAEGSFYAALLADLRLYRRECQRWRRRCRALEEDAERAYRRSDMAKGSVGKSAALPA